MSKEDMGAIFKMFLKANIISDKEDFDNEASMRVKRHYIEKQDKYEALLSEFNERWDADYKQFLDIKIFEATVIYDPKNEKRTKQFRFKCAFKDKCNYSVVVKNINCRM